MENAQMLDNSVGSVATVAAHLADEASVEGADAPSAPVCPKRGGLSFDGPSVVVTWANGDTLLERLAAMHADRSVRNAAVVLDMMNTVYKTMLETAKNLAPSEKEIALRRRRKQELARQIRLLEAKAVTIEAAVRRFENTMLSDADRQLLEANMARERPAMA